MYVWLDRAPTWSALDAGLPNVPVHDLKVHPRDRALIADVAAVQAAETARIEEALAKGTLNTPLGRKETPIAEAVRLGHPVLAPPGEYTLEREQGEARSPASFTIKPPEAFKLRIKPTRTRREK